jgi:hypothetical protein
MVDASKLLGVDVMTGDWGFTDGMARVRQFVDSDFTGRIDFVALNVRTADFDDPVFERYVIRRIDGVPAAILDQTFPLHADRQSALPGRRLDLRHPGGVDAEDRRCGARRGGRRSWSCCRTTAWTST